MFLLPKGEFSSEKACEMTNSPWKVHRAPGGWERRCGRKLGLEVSVPGKGSGFGWCLPMEVTAGGFGMAFAQENVCMPLVDFLNF